jgi:3-hydroxy-3-methylglutaryl CoA synthase
MPTKTRNQIKQEEQAMVAEFTHQFFEESSKAWMMNKEKYGQNMYRYKRGAFQEPLGQMPTRKSKRLLEKNTKTDT